jgi:catechol 2,3-dioxygenase-like lactoylglutathione lyase family enzyme
MYAFAQHKQEAVTLVVTDVLRSRKFYQDLLGLVIAEEEIPRSDSAVLQGLQSEADDLRIRLRQRLDHLDAPARIWLSIEVDTVSEVLDIYLLAIVMGAKALLPRKRGDRWNTVIFDPDGYRISLWTRIGTQEEQLINRGERPRRSAGKESSRHGYDARQGRSMDAAEHHRRWGRQGRDHLASERSHLTDTPAGRLPEGEGA